jgi:hypothetical protein
MLKLIDPLTDRRWDDFIFNHPEGLIYHHSSWAHVLTEKYGAVHKYYAMENDKGEILAVAPFFHLKNVFFGNQLICLPFADSCFPLANNKNDYERLLAELVQEVNQIKTCSMQIRGLGRLGLPLGSAIRCGHHQLFVQVIDINRELKAIRAGMTRNGRYNLRAAEKQPITVKYGQDEKDLRIFYSMLVDTLKRRNVLPPAYSYFRSIFTHIVKPGYGFILFAEFRGKIIAGNLYLSFKDTALCKYSAQIDSFSEYRPNYILHWKAIEHFHAESFRFYDFGNTDLNNDGLLFFKRSWGCEETSRSFYFYPIDNDYSPSKLLKTSNLILPVLKKHLPNFSRIFLGEIINRFTT